MDFEIGEHRKAPNMSIIGEGTLNMSTLFWASTLEPVGVSSWPNHPITTSIAIGFIEVPWDFLYHLIELHDENIDHLTEAKSKTAKLYVKIHPWVWKNLENVETQI